MLSINKVIVLFLFVFFATNFVTPVYYLLFFTVCLFFCIFIARGIKIPFSKREDYIAISFLLVWFYGFTIGFIRGNNLNYVIANFAGMTCYLFYFVLTTLKYNKKLLSKIILLSGLIVSVISIIKLFFYIFGVNIPLISIILGNDVGISSTGQLRVYFSTLTVAYPLLGMSIYSVLFSSSCRVLYLNKKIIALLLLIITIISLFFVASSKGFILGALFIILIIPFVVYIRKLKFLKIDISFLFFIFLCLCIIISLFYFDYFSIIEMMFDNSDSSNNVRYDQLSYIINDCSFFGNGLGSVVPGIVRSEEGPYGFELTYINLIHKFGVFSIILFLNWIYMFCELIILIYKNRSIDSSIVALSSMGYMLPSIGNPLLMHPSLVILNCITLYYIRNIRNE